MSDKKFIIVILIFIVILGAYLYTTEVYFLDSDDTANNVPDEKNKYFELLEDAIGKNPDVYAWIRIPDSDISYPVAQHPADDTFYLSHDSEREPTIYGAIFTEKYNPKNFDSFMTIIYGHAMRDGSMFGTIKKFKKKEYFDSHKEIYIYFDEKVYQYKVISAYKENGEHIFSKYDFTKEDSREAYINQLEERAEASNGYFRGCDGDKNKMVTLSTCNSSRDNNRWIVQGVLMNNE